LELYFVLRGNYLLKDEFWTALKNLQKFPITEDNFNDDVIIEIRKDFDAYINIGLCSISFSFIESRFRIFYNYVINNNEKGRYLK
jgi:hypothetical protein